MRTKRPFSIAVALAALLAVLAALDAAPASARSHRDFQDINCPLWSVQEPFAGYGVIGTNGTALCVKEYSGAVWGGGDFSESRGDLGGALVLYANYGGKRHQMAATGTFLTDCFSFTGPPLPYNLWILHIREVYLCAFPHEMHVQNGQRPPRGCYYGELLIRSEEGEHLLDAKSETRCF
jgi:hypothetical protein